MTVQELMDHLRAVGIKDQLTVGIGMGYLVIEDEQRNVVARIRFGPDDLVWGDEDRSQDHG